ncbi:potassium-transporting ATPase subunit KdpA [Methylobacter tundripaludum]|uniref:Potassium-transporting ATPase potassium-binding subunit n=1 Tax=Methylobacter tundripaludum (strain ATCC BAA-1195 / DSM 17260 / SV96) TaxID=697282 RepID=G3IQQ2_METTV|nr:potassium-transporting ATPase subunit KdpA [Methylobacter tundripaludum]EGW23252.1 Potassium-transporting ATPase A chain [Methylobacter tundripaludum SV96]
MTANGLVQITLYFVALLLLAKPLGVYMAAVYENRPLLLKRILGPLEAGFYRLSGVNPEQEMGWKSYAAALLWFNLFGGLAVFALQMLQAHLPLNPQQMANVTVDSAFNTAVSFATNTNWQGYSGETTMSYLTQMLGLSVQNFVSAATGMAVLVAMIRGFQRTHADGIGNFWADLTRGTLYILLPLSFVLALVLVGQGVVQTFKPYQTIPLVEQVSTATEKTTQTLAVGPAASQIAIKQLGTNGGGFFNVNSAHPFENPTPLANFLEMLLLILIPAALCHTFGTMVGDPRQGWAILSAMTLVLVSLLFVTVGYEQGGNPALAALGVEQSVSVDQSGGNMEGKETRFGIVNSAIWATATTAASNGSVNSMHDSYTPLGGMIPMWLIQLGEVIFGGVGSGLYGMLIFVLIAVFVAGLMIGRTPEYLGKKIEAFEIKMAAIVILIPAFFILGGTSLAIMVEAGKSAVANPGAHGFSEILYAFSSAAGNNGSAFAGLSANSPFYNTALGITMLFGRYGIMIPVLAIAGSLAAKKTVPTTVGTLPTHTPLFVMLLIGTVVLVGALTFVPALALGPVVEHLIMNTAL